eukprot:867728-Prorocentrum_minimum.AAC.2
MKHNTQKLPTCIPLAAAALSLRVASESRSRADPSSASWRCRCAPPPWSRSPARPGTFGHSAANETFSH